jgi:hypothetical protein
MMIPVTWFVTRHWLFRKKGNLNHYQLLGYTSLVFLVACIVSGLVLTWQGIAGPAISYSWDLVHIITGIGLAVFVVVHLAAIIVRKVKTAESQHDLRKSQRHFYRLTVVGSGLLLVLCGLGTVLYEPPQLTRGFDADYNWRFGEDRPFAPSMARLEYSGQVKQLQQQALEIIGEEIRPTYLAAFEGYEKQSDSLITRVRNSTKGLDLKPEQLHRLEAVFSEAVAGIKSDGSVYPRVLAGSESCGSAGCHQQIYKEWLPSAHRYSSLDHMFQRVQAIMVEETAPEFTRYCAGCHDPISLFSGAKDAGNITLSVEGSNEGSSCVICHSMTRIDIQGNGDYTVTPPHPYVYEWQEGAMARFVGDFLIRAYPWHHVQTYSRPLLKKPEFCASCHKQYVDREVNVDIGKVQGQNQYDSWKNSRWYHEDDPFRTVTCRECHMPLETSTDPASGDVVDYNRNERDGKHRSHRMLASNQYIPVDQELEGAQAHVDLVEKWLRGEVEIPEIADKWTSGPVVRMKLVVPEQVTPDENIQVQVILTNNKAGHDFPTGPLDMIESWVELQVTDDGGNPVYHAGALDERESVSEAPVIYKADGFDRKGDLIDRHNLWDLVGASYKRALYPGVTDTVTAGFQCPSMARGRLSGPGQEPGQRTDHFTFAAPAAGMQQLTVKATLWYRKANPDFLDRIYGAQKKVRSPLTAISTATASIRVVQPDGLVVVH